MSLKAIPWRRAALAGAVLVVLVVAAISLATSGSSGAGASASGEPPPGRDPVTDADADAAGCEPTESNPGTDRYYIPNAPQTKSLGRGFVISGTVRSSEDCAPQEDVRVQIWLSDDSGDETENRASVVTDARGRYRIEAGPPQYEFGEPHVHLIYDDDAYRRVLVERDVDPSAGRSVIDLTLAPRENGS